MKEYKVEINKYGDTRWYKLGTDILHREDGPAEEYSDGEKFWYQNGKYHREDGPALEFSNGHKHWYQNGLQRYFSKELYEKELAQRNNYCVNKVVEIEGKKYKLVEV